MSDDATIEQVEHLLTALTGSPPPADPEACAPRPSPTLPDAHPSVSPIRIC